MTTEKTIRDKYFANEIFKYGDIVEDVKTGESMKILDRGSNYVTVAIGEKIIKKWLNEVQEVVLVAEEKPEAPNDFIIMEDGQIKLFGHVTSQFDAELSELVLEQFNEFDDLYSKHQIVKCLDYAIGDTDVDRAYDLLLKVESFYDKKSMQSPFIVEALKTDIERRRMAEIIAAVADIKPLKTTYQTVSTAIKTLRDKYHSRKQWEVLWPLFKLAMASGIDGIRQNLPYTFDTPENSKVANESLEDTVFYATCEENIDMLIEDIDWDDIQDAFVNEEFDDGLITEVLDIEARTKLSRKMHNHSDRLAARRARALTRAATTDVLMNRARRLAETMLKRRMFHKSVDDLTRQEKERFEAGATGRRALVSKLAQRLIAKVRQLQTARVHHIAHGVTHKKADTVGTGDA